MRFLAKFLRVATLFVLLGLLIYGLKLGDFAETRYNGSILCISCIGIE